MLLSMRSEDYRTELRNHNAVQNVMVLQCCKVARRTTDDLSGKSFASGVMGVYYVLLK